MESPFNKILVRLDRVRQVAASYPAARVMAVVKTRSVEEINFAIRSGGIRLLGENRVQELLSHYEALDQAATIHFIGTLQKNKVKYIIDKVSMIESLDNFPLAAEIEKRAAAANLVMPVLIEVNSGREANKSGILPEALTALCKQIATLPHLRPMGLMTIAPVCENPEDYHHYFSETRRLLNDVFLPRFPSVSSPVLSMGMSGNYPIALSEGSNIIRLGEAIFGKRDYSGKPETKFV